MNIIIVGAGDVGFQLANMLSKEEHNVCVIDNNKDRLEAISEKVDGQLLLGSGTNAITLERAGITEADLFIAVSSIDEVNIMSCLLAKEYQVKRIVARVANPDYVLDGSKLSSLDLGIERVVNPLQVVSEKASEICNFGDATELDTFFDHELYHLCYPIKKDSPHIGNKVYSLGSIDGEEKLIITSITRNDKTFIPTIKDTIEEGDMIYFFCLEKDIADIRKRFYVEYHETKKVFIIGGGRIGYQVAKRLEQTNNKVKIFDRDRSICEKIADDLNVDVFCTVNTDVETFENEGIESADVVVTLMNEDNSNILTALLGKKLGAKKAVSLINSKKLTGLAYSLGVDSTISPRLATASAILKFVRRGNIISVVEKAGAEILEISITGNSEITKKSIKDLHIPEGIRLGAIKRGQSISLVTGDIEFREGDKLVVYTLSKSVPKLEKLIEMQ